MTFAQKEPKTVTEFYLALPGGIYGIEGIQDTDIRGFEDDFLFYSNERNESQSAIRKYRRSLIKVEDIKNGYLRLESAEWEGRVELALFKKADGTYLFAVSQVSCGPGCSGGMLFLTYKGGKWKNVTKQVFPYTFTENYFKLPHIGTAIELVCGADGNESCRGGTTLSEFQWDGEKFSKRYIR